jgi:hypothetical protein
VAKQTEPRQERAPNDISLKPRATSTVAWVVSVARTCCDGNRVESPVNASPEISELVLKVNGRRRGNAFGNEQFQLRSFSPPRRRPPAKAPKPAPQPEGKKWSR